MSYDLTPERLQEISVRVVSKFMTKQAGLSGAIADEAKSLELNPDQIKRVIESSNTIAYLRQLEDASDRSFEFPVAEYRDVMGKMILPDEPSPTVNDTNAVTSCPVASSASPVVELTSSMGEQEKVAMLFKETMRVKQTLTKMASEEMIMCFKLDELASKIQKDPYAIEKIAHIFSEFDREKINVLCGLEKLASTTGSVFNSKELSEVMSLDSLFKEAKDLLTQKNEKEEFVKRAMEVLEKKAFESISTKVGNAAGAIPEGVGYVAGKLGRGILRAGTGVTKATGSAIMSLSAGKTLGERLTGAADVGAAVLSASEMKHNNPVWSSIHG